MATTVRAKAMVQDRAWGAHAITSGFMATIAMGVTIIVGFVLATNLGSQTGNTIFQWLYHLAHNAITNTTQNSVFVAAALYLVFGLIWALLYARLVEPLLRGAGWQRGLTFAMVPFLLSVIVFLPSVGGGFLGKDFGAGPLPVIGNFIMHMVYGITLGSMYAQMYAVGAGQEDNAFVASHQHIVMERSGQRAALGILVGIVVGAIVGVILGSNVFSSVPGNSDNLITGVGELSLAGAVLGASLGALAGSVSGLASLPEER